MICACQPWPAVRIPSSIFRIRWACSYFDMIGAVLVSRSLSPFEPGVVAHRVWKWKRWEEARVVLAWAARARDPGVGGSRTGTVTLTLTSTYRTELDLCLLL